MNSLGNAPSEGDDEEPIQRVKVRGLVINPEGKFLLGKFTAEGGGFYCPPGGSIEPDDESSIAGLKREFREELGVECRVGKLCYRNIFIGKYGKTRDDWFIVPYDETYKNIDLSVTSHGHELAEVGFYSEDDLRKEKAVIKPDNFFEIIRNLDIGFPPQ